MNGEERREKIAHILKEKQGKVRGSELACQMHVSRQIIVGDMALLKARGLPVVSTPRGYYLTEQEGKGYRKTLVCCHDRSHTAEELEMIISAGGMVHNVSVEHEVYGTLTAGLEIRNREDIRAFIERMKTKECAPSFVHERRHPQPSGGNERERRYGQGGRVPSKSGISL